MLWVIIGVIAMVFISMSEWREPMLMMMLILAGAVTGFFLAVMIGMLVIGISPQFEETRIEEKTLIAFNDRLSAEGVFFLGSGRIKEESYYFFYVKDGDGGARLVKALTKQSVIYEQDRQDSLPKIETQIRKPLIRWLYLRFDESPVKYKFYVPKGTILREFKADLQ